MKTNIIKNKLTFLICLSLTYISGLYAFDSVGQVAKTAPNALQATLVATSSTTPATLASIASSPIYQALALDDARFADSSKQAIDSDQELKDFVKQSENSVYSDSSLDQEINIIKKRILKIDALTDLKKKENTLHYILEGKKLDKNGNPIDSSSDDSDSKGSGSGSVAKFTQEDLNKLMAQQLAMQKPKTVYHVIATYGYNNKYYADVLENDSQNKKTKVVGDKLGNQRIVKIDESGIYVASGKGKSRLITVDTDAIANNISNSAINSSLNKSLSPSSSGNFGTFQPNLPSTSPSLLGQSDSSGGLQTQPLNMGQIPSPPSLSPPSPSVGH